MVIVRRPSSEVVVGPIAFSATTAVPFTPRAMHLARVCDAMQTGVSVPIALVVVVGGWEVYSLSCMAVVV